MHRTYFADRGALQGQAWPSLSPIPFIPCSNFRFIQGGKFDCEGKDVFTLWNWSQPRDRGIAFAHISRSTGEDRIGRKPFLYRGRGNAILTQLPERFGP
jgi:hypothetical protein